MMQRAKILFDLNGYLVVRNVLSQEEVAVANAAIDACGRAFAERHAGVMNAKDSATFGASKGRLDLGGMLGWKAPYCDVFREMLCHKNLSPYLDMLVGPGYRLDHSPLLIRQEKDCEGFNLHGGSVTKDNRFIPELQYVCSHGDIYNSLLAVSYQLSDTNQGDGGFCVVRGSHKLNFGLSEGMMNGQDEDFVSTFVDQPCAKAGDVIIFSEATVHGCLPWKADHARQITLFRFSPANCAFARGYSNGWPASFLQGMTDRQLAVMQPPYHRMYDRAYIDSSTGYETVSLQERSKVKKDFDQVVFGQEYF